jgi:NAD(P)-dependent dehydrogenase (short-subunit alcohol dehydrogenase family)
MANEMTANTAIRNKVIVITGCARGIGLATATALHGLGAKVAMATSTKPS